MKKLIRSLLLLSLLFGWLGSDGWLSASSHVEQSNDHHKGPYLVIAAANYDKYSPVAAYDSLHDEYLVVWEAANGYHQIFGRRLRGDGTLLSSFLISNATYPGGTFNRYNPAVAYDAIKDQYLVLWAYDSAGDSTDWDVYARYLPWDGPVASQAEFGMATDRMSEYKPRLAFNTVNGDFIAIWLTDGSSDHPVQGTLIHPDGKYTLLDISSGGSAERDFPDVTFNPGLNQYLVAWDLENSTLDVYAVRLDSLGAIVSPGEIPIANSTIKQEQHPNVAACWKANQFLIVYQQTRNGATDDDIFGSFLYGNGTLTGPFFVTGTTAPQGYPSVSCDASGSKYFVAWQDMYAQPQYRYGIWGEWLQTDQTISDAFEIVRPSDLRDRRFPLGSCPPWWFGSMNVKTLPIMIFGG